MGIQGMVTRKGWDGTVWGANQHLSVSEAIAVNTCHGAWASGEEAIKGSIAAGKLADYVVLADDPHAVDVEKIRREQRDRTHGGGWENLAPDLATAGSLLPPHPGHSAAAQGGESSRSSGTLA